MAWGTCHSIRVEEDRTACRSHFSFYPLGSRGQRPHHQAISPNLNLLLMMVIYKYFLYLAQISQQHAFIGFSWAVFHTVRYKPRKSCCPLLLSFHTWLCCVNMKDSNKVTHFMRLLEVSGLICHLKNTSLTNTVSAWS